MEFVECIGFQHHTAKGRGNLKKKSANHPNLAGIDLHYFRYCFGPGLFFRADGSVDKDPIHFWFPWLSDKLSSSEILLEPLDFLPARSFSLEDLIRAYTPGQLIIRFFSLDLERFFKQFFKKISYFKYFDRFFKQF